MPETLKPTATTILTSEFWYSLGELFNDDTHTIVGGLIQQSNSELYGYSRLTYDDLPFWAWLSAMSTEEIARLVYIAMGQSFSRIFDALTANYNPLENFFTDGTFTEAGSGSNTKSGSVTTTPSGSVSTTYTGSKETEYGNRINVGQGTTYETASNTIDDSAFRNISKNISDGKVTDSFNNYGSSTTFNNPTTQTFNNLKDTASTSKTTTENKKGNSGIFSKQDLTQREVNLRIKNRIFPILVRMVVDVLNTGVYSSDD